MTTAVAVKVLAALIALQLGLGGVGVATVGGTDAAERVGTGVDPEGQDAAGGGPPPAPDASTPGAPDTGPPAAGSPGPEAGGGSGPPTVGTAPRAGTYRLRSDNSGTIGFGTSTTTFDGEQEYDERYEHVAGPAGETRVREMVDDKADDEVRFSGYTEFAWSSKAQLLTTELHVSERSADGAPPEETRRECDWEPDIPVKVFPLRPGLSWGWQSSCTARDDDSETTETRKGGSKVTGTRQIEIGGRQFAGWVVQTSETRDSVMRYTLPGPGGGEREHRSRFTTTAMEVFVPTIGLVGHAESSYEHESDGFSEESASHGEGRGTTVLLTPDPG